MEANGCQEGHINANTLAECLATNVLDTAPAGAGKAELVLMPGHHLMCVHAQLEPMWCARKNRRSLSLCRPSSCSATQAPSSPSSGVFFLKALGPANGGTPLPPFAFLSDHPSQYSQGSLVLKCRYSVSDGSGRSHAFDDHCVPWLRLRDSKKRARDVDSDVVDSDADSGS